MFSMLDGEQQGKKSTRKSIVHLNVQIYSWNAAYIFLVYFFFASP